MKNINIRYLDFAMESKDLYLFFLDNFRSEAKDVLGDDWVQRHRRIVQQNANQYKRVAWAKVCQVVWSQALQSHSLLDMFVLSP